MPYCGYVGSTRDSSNSAIPHHDHLICRPRTGREDDYIMRIVKTEHKPKSNGSSELASGPNMARPKRQPFVELYGAHRDRSSDRKHELVHHKTQVSGSSASHCSSRCCCPCHTTALCATEHSGNHLLKDIKHLSVEKCRKRHNCSTLLARDRQRSIGGSDSCFDDDFEDLSSGSPENLTLVDTGPPPGADMDDTLISSMLAKNNTYSGKNIRCAYTNSHHQVSNNTSTAVVRLRERPTPVMVCGKANRCCSNSNDLVCRKANRCCSNSNDLDISKSIFSANKTNEALSPGFDGSRNTSSQSQELPANGSVFDKNVIRFQNASPTLHITSMTHSLSAVELKTKGGTGYFIDEKHPCTRIKMHVHGDDSLCNNTLAPESTKESLWSTKSCHLPIDDSEIPKKVITPILCVSPWYAIKSFQYKNDGDNKNVKSTDSPMLPSDNLWPVATLDANKNTVKSNTVLSQSCEKVQNVLADAMNEHCYLCPDEEFNKRPTRLPAIRGFGDGSLSENDLRSSNTDKSYLDLVMASKVTFKARSYDKLNMIKPDYVKSNWL